MTYNQWVGPPRDWDTEEEEQKENQENDENTIGGEE